MIDPVSEIDIDCSLFLSVSWSDGIIVTESLVVEWPLIPIVNASGVGLGLGLGLKLLALERNIIMLLLVNSIPR